MKYYHQFQFAGYYAAINQGFYAEEGLTVELIEYQDESWSIGAVVEGRADFGVSNMEVLQARAQGLPVVILAMIIQHSPVVVLTRQDSNIRLPMDLIGRRVMSHDDNLVEVRAFLSNQGVDPDDVHFLPYEESVDALLAGTIDASVVYASNEPNVLRLRGSNPHLLYPVDYGIDFYGDNLFTSEALAKSRPDLVERFLRASLRGWRYALDHQEEMIDYILTLPIVEERGLDREHLLFEAQQIERLMNADLVTLGHINPQRVDRIISTLQSLHLIPEDFSHDGLLFTPPSDAFPWIDWLGYLAWLLGGLLFLGLLTALWHQRLRRAVRQKTQELQETTLKAQAANQAKAHFLANMSHELRTPLNGVIGPVSLLQEENLTPEQAHLLQLLRANADHLLHLINDLLDFARFDAGTLEIKNEPFDLRQLLRDFQETWSVQALGTHGLHFYCEVDPSVSAWVRGDALRLRQILTNLTQNAFKFTSQGRITVRVNTDANAPDHLFFSVEDTGPGIASSDLAQLFDRFVKVHQNAPHRKGGAGLGLAICRELCQLMGGSIHVKSVPGEGSTFTFRLPLPAGEAPVEP